MKRAVVMTQLHRLFLCRSIAPRTYCNTSPASIKLLRKIGRTSRASFSVGTVFRIEWFVMKRLNRPCDKVAELARRRAAESLGPGSFKSRPFGRRQRAVFDYVKPCSPIAGYQSLLHEFERERAESESFDLRAIAFGIESHDDLQPCVGCADAPQIAQHRFVAGRQRAQQAAPRKMRVNLIGHAVKLCRQVFDRRLDEE